MPAQLSPRVARWLQSHHGIATTADLRRLGLSRKHVERLRSIGVLNRPARGIYVLAEAHATLDHRCRLLSSLYPAGFVTGPTAGQMAGLRRMPKHAPLHFSVPHGLRLDPIDGVRFRQTTSLVAADRWTRPDGIVVASWTRLAFDLAADLRRLDHRSVIQELLDKQRVTPDGLVAIGDRLCHPARRGSTTFRLSLCEIGGVPQDSHPEVELADALLRRDVPIEPQVPVQRNDGVTVHIDLAVPAARWGVELDIHPEHRTVDGRHRDSDRERALHVVGWQVEPVAELDMVDVEKLADQLERNYRQRAASEGVAVNRGSWVPTGGPPTLR